MRKRLCMLSIQGLITTIISLMMFGYSHAALGDQTDPASSCMQIKIALPSSTDGLYRLQSGSMTVAKQYYCDMTTNGGGRQLLFQRREGQTNIESCGANLNEFLHNDCGSVTNLTYGDSYSSDVDAVIADFSPTTYMNIQYNASMTADTDDAFVIKSTTNIFPNNIGVMNNIPVDAICDINSTNCDTTDTYWKYVGDSFFGSSYCSAGYASRSSYSPPLEGNYGYCQNGLGAYSSNGLFGSRNGYNETKLWRWSSGGMNRMERVFIRPESPAPTDISLSNTSFDGSGTVPGVVGTLSTTDPTPGDTHTYSFVGSYNNSNFSISGDVLSISSVTQAQYTIMVQSTDTLGFSTTKPFVINVTGVPFPGTLDNPIQSCQDLKINSPTSPSGTYRMQNASMANPKKVYCEQVLGGGGWMLLFQRRGGYRNTEACGTDLNNFLHNDCGSVTNLAYGDSYSSDVDQTIASHPPNEYMNIHYNTSMVADTDDAFVIKSTSNIFPNSVGSVQNIPVNAICDINGANCDTTDAYRKYVGDSFFGSARCSSGYASRSSYSPPLEGDFGYCHNGLGSYAANSLFGNRSGYSEVKLRQFPTGSEYMERVFVRSAYVPTGSVQITAGGPITFGSTAQSTSQILTQQFTGYFSVADTLGSDTGRYTTIQTTNLAGPQNIPSSNILFQGGTLETISGVANPLVSIHTGVSSYTTISSPKIFFLRSPGPNSNVKGTYGSKPSLRITIPAYQTPGTYQATLTHTLMER